MEALLRSAAERSIQYLQELGQREVAPSREMLSRLNALEMPLPDNPTVPGEILDLLDRIGSPATVASAGPRYFGFVVGGSLPVTIAANWLAAAWDQASGAVATSPVNARLEEIVRGWLLDLLALPPESAVGFVTGATTANFSALAAARHAILRRTGWDVESSGLFGAPEITVVVGEEVHVSVPKALSMLGLGRKRITKVPVDEQGRMRADSLPELTDSTIVCIQAGNVNTGAFDPAVEICAAARAAGAWVHVDGAFGLWAAATPTRAHLAAGFSMADSWALDGHKWLNVPYDSGIVICRDEPQLRAAMSFSAAYLTLGDQREPSFYTPELSRRARGVDLWAALLFLGRSGLADLVEKCCRLAQRFADGLEGAGHNVLNEVVLNQVLVSFSSPEITRQVIGAVQEDGTCWCGGTRWQGHVAMRISVSSWATTEEDVDSSLEAILGIASRYH
jgi:glutamate/tyrosine decarboxylase-like PLP-dependent enzyme